MAIHVEVKNSDPYLTAEIRCDALRVIDRFEDLPKIDLLAFFDDVVDACFPGKPFKFNRGWSQCLDGCDRSDTCLWPRYVDDLLYPYAGLSRAYDHFIYLRGTASTDPVGRVMTFAHELQHFIQQTFKTRLYEENHVVFRSKLLPDYKVPTEHEARIVAKRIARKLRGDEAVNWYLERLLGEANREIEKGVTDPDSQRAAENEIWNLQFIWDLDCDSCYDLEAETAQVFHQLSEHRDCLENVLRKSRDEGVELKHVDLQRYYGE